MVASMKESGRMAKSMAREYIHGVVVKDMKDSLRITNFMDME
jgi:hypothetical protein